MKYLMLLILLSPMIVEGHDCKHNLPEGAKPAHHGKCVVEWNTYTDGYPPKLARDHGCVYLGQRKFMPEYKYGDNDSGFKYKYYWECKK